MSRMGPFGLRKGMTLAELAGAPREIGIGKYLVSSVPRPHSAFESYALQVTPKTGLSWIKAIGHTIQTSVYGIELQTAFDDLESKLERIYGKGKRTDLLMPGSIWNEPRDWMQAILNKERFLMTMWSAEHGSQLPDALQSVGLVVGAIESDSGFVAVEYAFDNKTESEAEIAAAEDDAL